jgi:ribulose-5-phosphate 4-epimerase/fuculose-1-phosphate aldolase
VPDQDAVARFVDGLRAHIVAAGHPQQPAPDRDTRVVLHPIEYAHPKAFRRRSAATFVVAVVAAPGPERNVLQEGYPFLLRALANLCVFLVPHDGRLVAHFITLERGVYRVDPAGLDAPDYLAALYARIAPLALSRLVLNVEYVEDLDPLLREGDLRTFQLRRAGTRLDALGLLPAPFPLEELLSERERKHVQRLFHIGGLSYGNLSARRSADAFWMSASGVDKSDLQAIGRDMLLVSGFDPHTLTMRVSVPPGLEAPRRPSVDAIEHWMIYHRHPEVGAIVHVHAWIDGVASTQINYPCGTVELARSVADLVAAAPEPGSAVIGQKNHGLTITGPDLPAIFRRIEGRIQPQVPMAA